MAFTKNPRHMRQRGNTWELFRAVPIDLRKVVGKSTWSVSGGRTLREAQSRLPAFLAWTDQEIVAARNPLKEQSLSLTERIEGELASIDLSNRQEVNECREWLALLDDDQEDLTLEDLTFANNVLDGKERLPIRMTGQELLELAKLTKNPRTSTYRNWQVALKKIIQSSGVRHTTSISRQHCLRLREELLRTMAPSSVSTNLNFLSGLFQIQEEETGVPNPMKGLTKIIRKSIRPKTTYDSIWPVSQWPDHKYKDLFLILLKTGARCHEIAALRDIDITGSEILIRPWTKRVMKTSGSERKLPIHSDLLDTVLKYKGDSGKPLWPELYQEKQDRWGAYLGKHCKEIAGTSKTHTFRHHAITLLRNHGVNQVVMDYLIGHSQTHTQAYYGILSDTILREAIELL